MKRVCSSSCIKTSDDALMLRCHCGAWFKAGGEIIPLHIEGGARLTEKAAARVELRRHRAKKNVEKFFQDGGPPLTRMR